MIYKFLTWLIYKCLQFGYFVIFMLYKLLPSLIYKCLSLICRMDDEENEPQERRVGWYNGLTDSWDVKHRARFIENGRVSKNTYENPY